MVSQSSSTRPYHSPRREEAARATRRAVLDGARKVFLAKGYAGATIDEIARVARVSRPTVFSVGNKAELLKLVRDVAIAGDDEPVAIPDRESYAEVRNAPDAETALRLHARNVVDIAMRYAEIDEVLRQAVSAGGELRQLWEDSEEQRLAGARIVVDDVMEKGALRAGVDRRRAADVLWLLMAPDQLRRMLQRGWSAADFEAWLGDTFVALLLP